MFYYVISWLRSELNTQTHKLNPGLVKQKRFPRNFGSTRTGSILCSREQVSLLLVRLRYCHQRQNGVTRRMPRNEPLVLDPAEHLRVELTYRRWLHRILSHAVLQLGRTAVCPLAANRPSAVTELSFEIVQRCWRRLCSSSKKWGSRRLIPRFSETNIASIRRYVCASQLGKSRRSNPGSTLATIHCSSSHSTPAPSITTLPSSIHHGDRELSSMVMLTWLFEHPASKRARADDQ